MKIFQLKMIKKFLVPSNCALASHRIQKTYPWASPNRPTANWIARPDRWLPVDISDSESLSFLPDKHYSHRFHHRAMQCPLSSNLLSTELYAHLKRWKQNEMNINFCRNKKNMSNLFIFWWPNVHAKHLKNESVQVQYDLLCRKN